MLILATWSQTSHSCFPLSDVDHLEIENCSNLPLSFTLWAISGNHCLQDHAMKIWFWQERAIIVLGLHSFRGDSAGGSKLIEQTLIIHLKLSLRGAPRSKTWWCVLFVLHILIRTEDVHCYSCTSSFVLKMCLICTADPRLYCTWFIQSETSGCIGSFHGQNLALWSWALSWQFCHLLRFENFKTES